MEEGGAQTHILTLSEALLAYGHTVTVASPGGRLTAKLRALGIRHIDLPPCRPRNLLKICRVLNTVCQSEHIDCIHAHARLVALAADLVTRRRTLPLVTTVHAHFPVDPLRRPLSRWGAQTIAVSEDLSQYLCQEYKLPKNQITVIPNGIKIANFAPPTSAVPRLVFCSRLDGDCSAVAFLLCEIAEALHREFPDLKILLIGGGSSLAALQQRINEIHTAVKAKFLFCTGAVDAPIQILRTNDCFIGVSRAALEAMSVGIPVILAGNEGFLGILTESELPLAEHTNFCCRGLPSPCAQALLAACRKLLLLSEQERTALGTALQDYVYKHHTVSRTAEKTIRIYRAAISQQHQHTPPKHLILCGYYGYGNLGDDTLLQEALRRAKRDYPLHTVRVLTAKSSKNRANTVLRTSPLAILSALKKSDVLIFGGGTLLQDTTSFRSLLYYSAILRYAQACGVRCELWANGLGRPHSRLSARIMREALRRCDHIGLRDQASITLARSLGINEKKLHREEDLALGLFPCKPSRIEALVQTYRLDKRFVIVAPKGKSNKKTVRCLQKHLTALRNEGITVLWVPLFPKEDTALCQRLCQSERDRFAQGLCAQELIGLMQQSVGVLGMRLHALIFAQNANVPFVGFGKDEKLQSFCKEHSARCFSE